MYSFIFRAIKRLVSLFPCSRVAAGCSSSSSLSLRKSMCLRKNPRRRRKETPAVSLFISPGVFGGIRPNVNLQRRTRCSPPSQLALLQFRRFFHIEFPLLFIPQWFAVIQENKRNTFVVCFGRCRGDLWFTLNVVLSYRQIYRLLYAINWGNFDNCSVVGFISDQITVKGGKCEQTSSSCTCAIFGWINWRSAPPAGRFSLACFLLYDFDSYERSSVLFCGCKKRQTARLSLKPNDLLYEAN